MGDSSYTDGDTVWLRAVVGHEYSDHVERLVVMDHEGTELHLLVRKTDVRPHSDPITDRGAARLLTANAEVARLTKVLEGVRALADELERERPSSGAWRGAYRNNARRIRAVLDEEQL